MFCPFFKIRGVSDDEGGGGGGRRSTQSTPRLDRSRIHQTDNLRESRRSCGGSVSSIECNRVYPVGQPAAAGQLTGSTKAVVMNRSWETDGTDPPGVDKAWEVGRQKGQEMLMLQNQEHDSKRGREKKRSQPHKKKKKNSTKNLEDNDLPPTSVSPNRQVSEQPLYLQIGRLVSIFYNL